MGNKYDQLNESERYQLSYLLKEGKSLREIGAIMARAPSTISREVRRNSNKKHEYVASYAEIRTLGRRWRGSKLERDEELREAVLSKLKLTWSPEQVSCRLLKEGGEKRISPESIYRFIAGQIRRTKDYSWRNYLPQKKSKRGHRGSKAAVLSIKDRVSISERPEKVNKRVEVGHWEADLMLFGTKGQSILTLHERSTMLTILFKNKSKHSKLIAAQMCSFFKALPPQLARSVTFDNGTEFYQHHRLNELGIKTYFCDIRSPWQKGSIENTIGRIRRVLHQKFNLSNLSNFSLNNFVRNFNQIPRKRLNFFTPAEIFYKHLLHFKCESTFPPARE